MALLFDSWIIELALTLLTTLYVYLTWNFTYWKKKGVPYAKPNLFFGNLKDLILVKKTNGQQQAELYRQLKGNAFGGIFLFRQPALLLRDPDVIKTFLVKDFEHFFDRALSFDSVADPLMSRNLLAGKGQRWKDKRMKLTPTFTSGKIKRMFPLFQESAEQLLEHLHQCLANNQKVEMKDVLARFTTELIVSVIFGIESNSLKDPHSEFRRFGRKVFEPSWTRAMVLVGQFVSPSVVRLLRLRFFPKDVSDFFRAAIMATMKHREETKIVRRDFMDLLIQLKSQTDVGEEHEEDQLSNLTQCEVSQETVFESEDILAHAMEFYVAGFETSGTALSFVLYELALHPEIQKQLRSEIDESLEKTGGEISYDSIQEMNYLDMVIAETLRKYPPFPILDRKCMKDYVIPGTNVTIEEGTSVVVPIFGIHYDPQYYPDPEKFDPERFSEENKKTRTNYTYMPFGEGPRKCVGARFGLMQMKTGIVYLISKFEFHPSDRTPVPLVMDPRTMFIAIRGGLWLNITERNL